MTTATTEFVDALPFYPEWIAQIRANAIECEARRAVAKYNTGTISEAACLYLRSLTEHFKPDVAIEIGTFIGSSAMAINAGHLYTCDKSNGCFPSSKRVTAYPYTRSTSMLKVLADLGLKVDFFFFDGRIKDADEKLIVNLSLPSTVYTFDDYEGREKGVLNVERMRPYLPKHALILPPSIVPGADGVTTIAVLAP